jgi:hypothetical protein
MMDRGSVITTIHPTVKDLARRIDRAEHKFYKMAHKSQ